MQAKSIPVAQVDGCKPKSCFIEQSHFFTAGEPYSLFAVDKHAVHHIVRNAGSIFCRMAKYNKTVAVVPLQAVIGGKP